MGSSGAVLLLKAAKPNDFVREALGQDASSFNPGGAPLLRRGNLRGRHSLPTILYRRQNGSTRPHIRAPRGPPALRLPAGRVPLPGDRSVPSPLQGGFNPRDSAQGAPGRDRGGNTGHGMRGTGMAAGKNGMGREGEYRVRALRDRASPLPGTDSPARPRCRRLPEARARHNSRGPGPPPGTETAAASMRAAASACPVPGGRGGVGRDGTGRGGGCSASSFSRSPQRRGNPRMGPPEGISPPAPRAGCPERYGKGVRSHPPELLTWSLGLPCGAAGAKRLAHPRGGLPARPRPHELKGRNDGLERKR